VRAHYPDDGVVRGNLLAIDLPNRMPVSKSFPINSLGALENAFAGEVSRVAREVGTEGKLGGQAEVPGVAGTWKDLTDNVNFMASNLTGQVRNIADVTTAVAREYRSPRLSKAYCWAAPIITLRCVAHRKTNCP
jgi:hypothetical protein